MKTYHKVVFMVLTAAMIACDPSLDDDIHLGPLPGAPEFGVEFVPGDSNRVVVADLSDNSFDRLWVFEGGDPRTSKLPKDTVLYVKAGEFEISLHVADVSGNGTAVARKTVMITRDIEIPCDDKLALLTGECGPQPKCWTLSMEAGAVTVGPTYGSSQWYTSPAGGLQPEQYDDGFCFLFEGREFLYQNNGATIDPWNGYAPVAYDPPVANWTFREGTGMNGVDQIALPEGVFMGVWDSGNILDVIILTEEMLVVRAPLVNRQGVPQAEGWFELHFVAQ